MSVTLGVVKRPPIDDDAPLVRARLANATSPLRIVYGDRFECEVGPETPVIDVTPGEWEHILQPTGLFVLEEAEPEASPSRTRRSPRPTDEGV